jgi:dinuclear metal center YbgI/SA1388 family protein
MDVRSIIGILERWAPRDVAMQDDNPGLQCGSVADPVRGILVSLDADLPVIQEAVRKRRTMIVTHHPFLFRPLRSIDTGSERGKIIELLLRHRISLYAAHTNLDFSAGGTSHALAEALGVTHPVFLRRSHRLQKKIVTFVPPEHVDRIAQAMAAAGAGILGDYDECSFRVEGIGTFRGNEKSSPTVGKRGRRERVRETRLEMVVAGRQLEQVIGALQKEHPYEEVAYDVFPCENVSTTHGAGVVGSLRRPVALGTFLLRAKRTLGVKALRYTGNPARRVRTIAVCGGSGAELLDDALAAHADVFLTADVKYHDYQRARGKIALVDAGHFETELPVVPVVAQRLRTELRAAGSQIPVGVARSSRNPVLCI